MVVMMEMQDTINALQRELSSMRNAQPQEAPQQVCMVHLNQDSDVVKWSL